MSIKEILMSEASDLREYMRNAKKIDDAYNNIEVMKLTYGNDKAVNNAVDDILIGIEKLRKIIKNK